MTVSDNQYVHRTAEGGWRITGTRVSLDSIIHMYLDGDDAESIVRNFPSVSLSSVHAAIDFYLEHRDFLNRYLADQGELWVEVQKGCATRNADMRRKIQEAMATRENDSNR